MESQFVESPRESSVMKKIMVIDDNPEFLTMMEAWLESEQFKSCLCQDARRALEKARFELPNLIILDLMMPNKPGVEVLAELKTDSTTGKIPVIVLTAASLQAEESHLLVKRLADDSVLKPFEFDHLLARINHLVAN